jgi:energy-coupling factor transporter ATP-binding protein EcfA2
MNKTEKLKNIITEALATLKPSPHNNFKVIPESKVTSPQRDSIPLLFLNMIMETAFLHPTTNKEYNPINVLFIGKSGTGKSRLLETLRGLDFVYYCEDITPKHLKDFLESARKNEKRFLVIPDFNSILHAHGQKTQHTTLSILRELMSDGITNLASYGMEFESKFPVKAGVLTAMTIDNYSEFRETWKKTGFLNRFIPYSFKHSDLTKDQILHSIFYHDETRFINPKPYNIIKNPLLQIMQLDGNLIESLTDIAEELAEIVEATPYRDAIRLTDL